MASLLDTHHSTPPFHVMPRERSTIIWWTPSTPASLVTLLGYEFVSLGIVFFLSQKFGWGEWLG
jgi:hypothetical protein